MQVIYTKNPFEGVSMNIIGFEPATKRENKYIFTVLDYFTKHVKKSLF